MVEIFQLRKNQMNMIDDSSPLISVMLSRLEMSKVSWMLQMMEMSLRYMH